MLGEKFVMVESRIKMFEELLMELDEEIFKLKGFIFYYEKVNEDFFDKLGKL